MTFTKGMSRPAGAGRKKGTPNKRTVERQRDLARVKARGDDPHTFFQDVLRSKEAPLDVRMRAAEHLAPYMKPKLAAVEAVTGGKTHEDRLAELRRMNAEPMDEDGSRSEMGGRGETA